jgi:hypothetical protein
MSAPRRWTGGPAPQWSATPPPPKVKKFERLKILTGKGETLVIVSNRLEETLTHFVDSRTVPCTGEQGVCWLDHRDVGNGRYAGWLAVKFSNASKVWLVSLTPVAVATEKRLRDPNLDLRGLTIRLSRSGNHERTEMHARLLMDLPRVDVEVDPPDLRYCVERMWAAEDRPPFKPSAGKGIFGRALAAQQAAGSK